MISSKPVNIALIDALLITLIATIVYVLIGLIFHSLYIASIAVFAPVIFLSSYFIIKY